MTCHACHRPHATTRPITVPGGVIYQCPGCDASVPRPVAESNRNTERMP